MNDIDNLKKNKIIYPLLAILIIGILSLILLVLYSTEKVNKITHSHEYSQIKSAFSIEQKRLEELLVENTYWDEGYTNIIQKDNTKWVIDNLGPFLVDHLGINLVIAVDNNDLIHYQLVDGKETINNSKFDSKNIKNLITTAREILDEPNAQSGFFILNNTPYLISLDNFIPDYIDRTVDKAFLLFGRKIDSKYIEKINHLYKLNNLQLLDNNEEDPSTLYNIDNENGEILLSLKWDSKKPATKMIRELVIPLALTIIIIVLLSFLIIGRDVKQRRKYFSILESMALRDPLTNISNRRSFISLSEHELVRVKRTSEKLSLMMIDIDNFKQINDHLGHQGGDKVLVELSKLIDNFLRDVDIFARWGGEEFCILLPNTNKDQAIKIAERLRKKVQKANYRLKMLHNVGTISIGVAQYNGTSDIQDLINHADNALYQAKEKGRNCCVLIN